MQPQSTVALTAPSPIRRAFVDSLPVFVSYFSLGIVYGFMFVQMVGPWYLGTLMSTIVYAGAVQFLALGVFAEHGSLLAMGIAALFISMRCSFYGLSLLDSFSHGPLWRRFYMMFGLVDGTYAILTTKSHEDQRSDSTYALSLGLLIHSYWIVSTAIGGIASESISALIGDTIDFNRLEFILTAFYAVLTFEQYRSGGNLIPILIAAGTGLISIQLFPQHMLLVAICTSAALLTIWNRRTQS